VAESGRRVGELVDDLAASVNPVVLIGSRIIRETGAAAVDALDAANPRARVLLVGVDEATLAARADEAHADGYLCRSGELVAQTAALLAL
jgi:DNA-binding NarL/FixJ family response regulator